MPSKEGYFEHPRQASPRWRISLHSILISLAVVALICTTLTSTFLPTYSTSRLQNVPINAQQILNRCQSLRAVPQASFPWPGRSRKESDRYEPGTNATYIKNAIIYTGEPGDDSVIHGSIYLDKGIVKHIGNIPPDLLEDRNLQVIDAKGNWVTPGLIDLHSHIGLQSLPLTAGADDLNSPRGPVAPWLRTIDAFNTHDEAFRLAMAGGVTSAQVLPGGANAIGGQAFMVKLRKTSKGTPFSMIIEPPHGLVGSNNVDDDKTRWRYLMQTCGESVRKYGSRMDIIWSLREAFAKAKEVSFTQDQYCARAEAGLWDTIHDQFPEDFKYEALVDVLRGRVKVFSHCEEVVDLDSIVRLSNEFEFPIASFHHASEAWLVPELLKQTYGDKRTTGAALFATNHRYRTESFRGSEYAPRVLSDAGIPVVMKSDHPTIDSRYLIHEAQQAHYFGLAPNISLASVTYTPAAIAGLSHRIGILQEGADADVVLWDSHPLRIGATPLNVWIDGIMQIPVLMKNGQPSPVVIGKGKEDEHWRQVPDVPNWDKERGEALRWDGLPPLKGRPKNSILFTNVGSVWSRNRDHTVEKTFSAQSQGEYASVLVENGKIICSGVECPTFLDDVEVVDLRQGSIAPGLMTYGSPLGLEEIAKEPSTGDGYLYDAFTHDLPEILDDKGGILRAMDALTFGTRNALTAYQSGVTFATSYLSAPFNTSGKRGPVIAGLSTTFRTGAAHALQRGAIVQDVSALHIKIARPQPTAHRGISVSTQIAGLRRLLFGWESGETETGEWFKKAAEGVVPLVIEVESADIMASLLLLKAEVEDGIGSRMRMVFSGAAEAHLLAKEIAEASVGVILNPIRASPKTWSERRVLPGPPLSNDTSLVKLLESGVTVGVGVPEAWQARNTRFDIRWAALDSNGRVDEDDMYALAHSNLQSLLGIRGLEDDGLVDLVAYEGGGAFDMESKPVAVIAPQRGVVEFF